MSLRLDGGDTWVTPAMNRVIEIMRSRNMMISAFRDRRGRLRFLLANNEIVHKQTVDAMIEKKLLEMVETPEEAVVATKIHYRLAGK